MPAQLTKTPKVRSVMKTLIGYAFRGLALSGAAAVLGATLALGTMSAAPRATAEVAGPAFCPSGATALIGTTLAAQVRDWQGQVWKLRTPTLRCAAAQGLPVAPARAFDAVWYGSFAAGAAGMTGLVYGMWAIASTLAGGRPKAAGIDPALDYPAQFLAECCELNPKKKAPASQLYIAYAAWSRAKGYHPPARKSLARDWRRLGLRPRGLLSTHAWRGVRLKEQT
jgi:hypothetical protein